MSGNLSLPAAPGNDLEVSRGVTIRLRVTEAERDAMQTAAKKSGISLSEWIRRRCVTVTTTVAIVPVPTKPTKKAKR